MMPKVIKSEQEPLVPVKGLARDAQCSCTMAVLRCSTMSWKQIPQHCKDDLADESIKSLQDKQFIQKSKAFGHRPMEVK